MPDQPKKNGDAVADVQPDSSDTRSRSKSNAAAEGGQGENETQGSGEPDSTDGAAEALVDAVEEGVDAAVAGKGEHHAGVAGHAKEAAVPDA